MSGPGVMHGGTSFVNHNVVKAFDGEAWGVNHAARAIRGMR